MLTNAAGEGARVAVIQPVADDAAIRDAVRTAMAARGGITIADADIEITHWCKYADGTPDFTEKVKVTVNYTDIAIFGTFFGVWDNVISFSSMRKEGVTQYSTPPGSGLCSA